MAVKTLERFGHHVTVAQNGKEALEQVGKATFDVILMDGQMPIMDGLEATGLIRAGEVESKRRLPIIAMTAHAMKGDRERFIASGMDDYIAKPIDPDRLMEMLDKWGRRASAKAPTKDLPRESEAEHAEPGDAVPMDLKNALARACGDKAFLEEMIHHFVGDISEQLEKLGRILDTGDATGLAREAHTLKGSAATLGAGRIASVALQLELTGKSEDLSAGKRLLSELANEMGRLTDYVNRPDWLEVS